MDYNNIDDFYKQLDIATMNSMKKLATQIKEGLRRLINDEIYGSYQPQHYQRMGSLLDSIRVDIIQNGICDWSLDIYFSSDKHPNNNTWIGEESSFSEIFGKFAEDGFYRRDRSIDIMGMGYEEWIATGKALSLIKSYLQKQGINFS